MIATAAHRHTTDSVDLDDNGALVMQEASPAGLLYALWVLVKTRRANAGTEHCWHQVHTLFTVPNRVPRYRHHCSQSMAADG